MSLTPGTTLGPYAIVSQLGSGGMGVVYQAHDPAWIGRWRSDCSVNDVRFLEEPKGVEWVYVDLLKGGLDRLQLACWNVQGRASHDLGVSQLVRRKPVQVYRVVPEADEADSLGSLQPGARLGKPVGRNVV